VKAGEGLEYKVEMKAGQGLVYNVSYEGLEHPGLMVVEFHGHTPQVDGVGDLMFYSKTRRLTGERRLHRPLDRHPWLVPQERFRNGCRGPAGTRGVLRPSREVEFRDPFPGGFALSPYGAAPSGVNRACRRV